MMRSLIWKEWHEQRWQLAFGCIMLMGFAAIGLRARVVSDEIIVFSVIVIAVLIQPVLVSMSLIAPERADASFDTLIALPLKPRQVLAVKMLMGLATCAVPLAAAALVSWAIAGGRELSTGQILAIYARGIGTVLPLFMWMLAAGVELPTETRAGLIGLGMLVIWWLASAGLAATGSNLAFALSPFGFLPISEERIPPLLSTVCAQLLIGFGLWELTEYRFARERRRSA